MSLVWELELPDSEKLVLLALADCANDEGHCWPGMATLTKKCSKSDRTVQLAIKMLVTKGHLTRREVPGKGCNYTVHPIVRFAADPRSDNAPEVTTPPKGTTPTPEAASGKSSRTINTEAKASLGRVLEAWKKAGLPEVRVLTNERKQKAFARIREHGEATILEAIQRIRRSKFLTGQTDRGFKADFDFLLQPKSLTRILEGFYGDDAPAPKVKFSDLSREEQIQRTKETIAFYTRIDRPDEVAECRKRLAALEHPPDPKVTGIVSGLAKNLAA